MRRSVLLVMALFVALVAADCAAPVPTVAPTVVPTVLPTVTSAPPTALPTSAVQPTLPPAGNTAGELAILGNEVYKKSCAVCHDEPFAGNLSNGLQRFANAQQMFNYMQQNMPQGQPGTLPPEEYLQVLAMVLVEGRVVAPDSPLDMAVLASIAFKK